MGNQTAVLPATGSTLAGTVTRVPEVAGRVRLNLPWVEMPPTRLERGTVTSVSLVCG